MSFLQTKGSLSFEVTASLTGGGGRTLRNKAAVRGDLRRRRERASGSEDAGVFRRQRAIWNHAAAQRDSHCTLGCQKHRLQASLFVYTTFNHRDSSILASVLKQREGGLFIYYSTVMPTDLSLSLSDVTRELLASSSSISGFPRMSPLAACLSANGERSRKKKCLRMEKVLKVLALG